MNRQKPTPQEQPEVKPKKKNIAAKRKFLKVLNVFDLLSKEALVKGMPFIFFWMGLALVYIANSYQAERTIREIDSISKELKTLRTEHITESSELMFVCKQSEVARVVGDQGIKESVVAPRKIIVHNQLKTDAD